MSSFWTRGRMQYLRDNHETVSARDIAIYLGTTEGAVRAQKSRMNLTRTEWTEERLQYLRENYQTRSYAEMSEYLGGVSSSTISSRLKQMGLRKGHNGKHSVEGAIAPLEDIVLPVEGRKRGKLKGYPKFYIGGPCRWPGCECAEPRLPATPYCEGHLGVALR